MFQQLFCRASSLEPDTRVKASPKERIIPISFEKSKENSTKEAVQSPPAKPPTPRAFQTQKSSQSQRYFHALIARMVRRFVLVSDLKAYQDSLLKNLILKLQFPQENQLGNRQENLLFPLLLKVAVTSLQGREVWNLVKRRAVLAH